MDVAKLLRGQPKKFLALKNVQLSSKNQATVVYDPQLVTLETVQRALEGAGYNTQIVENSSVA
nr:hypothetical protein [Phormidium tenue]